MAGFFDGSGGVFKKKTMEDQRQHRRFPMRWQVAIIFDEIEKRPTYHGVTHEISLSGMSLLTDHNIFTEDAVTVLLAVPPLYAGLHKKIIEIYAHMIYTVHSSDHGRFRIGLKFDRFKGDGREWLEMNLRERVMIDRDDVE